jgi:hypothetical protein
MSDARPRFGRARRETSPLRGAFATALNIPSASAGPPGRAKLLCSILVTAPRTRPTFAGLDDMLTARLAVSALD